MHIVNLYRPEAQTILLFKECYSSEKLHGTSSNLKYTNNTQTTSDISLFSGGCNPVTFDKLFDKAKLLDLFKTLGHNKITIYGEAYGGKEQGMAYLYGKETKFAAFDVEIEMPEYSYFLSVPEAEAIAKILGLDFVPYKKIPCTLEAIDAERDADSVQAVKNGVDLSALPKLSDGTQRTALREGVVLRPLVEMLYKGARVCAKHKSDKFKGGGERKNTPKVDDPEKLKLFTDAQAAAEEFVTEMRLEHVFDKLPKDISMDKMPLVIKAMVEDVEREAKGEILENPETRKAISKKTVMLFKNRFTSSIPKE